MDDLIEKGGPFYEIYEPVYYKRDSGGGTLVMTRISLELLQAKRCPEELKSYAKCMIKAAQESE